MTDTHATYGLLGGRNRDRVCEDPLRVLYVDADASVREATRRAIREQRDDISMAGVADVDSARELAAEGTDCLIIDPAGLGSVEALLAAVDCPVVYYTARDPSEMDDALLEAGETVVEKDTEASRGALLAERIVSLSSPQIDKREYALNEALDDIERRAAGDETAVLADDDGTIVWTSAPLDEQFRGVSSEPTTVAGLLDGLVPDTPAGQQTRERLEDAPGEPVTIRRAEGAQYVLWTESRLPAAAGSLRLLRLRDVTDAARHQARERLLELLVESAQDGLYTLDADGNVDFCNEAFAATLGYDPREIIGRHASTLLAPDEFSRGDDAVQQLIDDPAMEETTVDLTHVHRDGTERDLSIHYSLLEGREGRYRGLLGVTRDVTVQVERQRELARYMELFESLVANFPNGGVFIFDEDLRYVEAGGRDLEDVGLEREDFIGKTPSEVFPPKNAALLEDAYRAALDGEPRSFQDSFGGYHYTVQVYPIRAASGSVSSGMAVARNVTEQVERERRLERFEKMVNSMQDYAAIYDRQGRFEVVNEALAEAYDATPAELEGVESWLIEEIRAESDDDPFQRLIDGEVSELKGHYEWESPGKGHQVNEYILSPMTYDGEVDGVLSVSRDVTAQRERERELQRLSDRLELALEGAGLGVWDWSVETDDVTFDERWASMLGYDHSEIDQRLETWEELVHPDDFERAWNVIQRHFEGETDIYECDYRMRASDGTYRWIRDLGRVFERDEDGTPRRMVGIHQDITDRKERQQEIEAQRDELETLTEIYVLIQDVIRTLGTAVTSADIEEMVCRRLVESEFYELAWIGERGIPDGHLTWKTGAGGEDYYDVVAERSRAVDREDDPGITAVETGEVQVIHDVADDERMAHWREAALDHDLRSAAVVPLVHDDVVHAALVVYANRTEAFSDRAIEAFTGLGEMVGFAFTAVQNRHLLLRDRMVELEFQSTDRSVWPVAVAARHDCRVEFVGCVSAGDQYLEYVSVSGAAPSAVLESCLELGPVTDGRVVSGTDGGDGGRLELTATTAYQPLMLDVGAQPTEIVAESDAITITAEAPLDSDPRTVHQTLATVVDGLRLTSKRQWTRGDQISPDCEEILDQLTRRQVEVLQAAYHAGYFAWPRDTTAEELADSLDISSPTLHQHLRRASLNLLEVVLDS